MKQIEELTGKAYGKVHVVVQLMALGEIEDLREARKLVRESFELRVYEPEDEETWKSHYKDERSFPDYLARLNRSVTLGKREVEVLVIHPITSAWCVYSKFDDEVDKLDRLFDETVKEVISNKLDFHFGDETILARHGKVENGKFVVGECDYGVVPLPLLLNLRSSTVAPLDEFVRSGGTVVVLKDFRYGKFFPRLVDGNKKRMVFWTKPWWSTAWRS